MKVAHLADLHLGFRRYQRITPEGVNQREADVARAFRTVVDGLIATGPDLVLVAGDHFHSIRPGNHAIIDAYSQWARFRAARPEVPVVIVSGNHDTPRTSEVGFILRLFHQLPGFYVAAGDPKDFRLQVAGTAVHIRAVPESNRPVPINQPDKDGLRILLLHGDTPSTVKWKGDPQGVFCHNVVPVEELARWDYAALGHYHVTQQVGEHAWYAGAIEYTSSDPWAELREEEGIGKAWLLVTFDGRVPTVERQPVPTRALRDLPVVDAAAMTGAELMDALRANLPAQYDGMVLRQVVQNVPPSRRQELDHSAIRRWKATALEYQLDLRRPARDAAALTAHNELRGKSLAEIVADHLAARPLPPDIDREALMRLADKTLADADAAHEAAAI